MTQTRNIFVPLALLLATAGVSLVFNLTQALGAHPWWAHKVIWLGLPLGVGLYATAWTLRLTHRAKSIGFALLTFVAFGLATLGKSRFAASFAEDAIAGQMWFLGWIATCALAAATLLSLVRLWRQKD